MGEAHSEASGRPAGRMFDAIERRLPFAQTLSAKINSLPDEPLEWAYSLDGPWHTGVAVTANGGESWETPESSSSLADSDFCRRSSIRLKASARLPSSRGCCKRTGLPPDHT